ncbi:4Fe-4S binding protein [Paralimibaculum aggregatum]|uniref:4Fe-4S binding protein n=1 Tax=Paralimibaculum aggregatum TaxID=3036245 RepID=A0ABQ6LRW4_9RHOB|nr:4Fe-4S binding protein [Limibaculum sp. NKW23]GMG84231.1 4Fe-4S binding protein [Limibaculum sp. NKW23]
MAEIVALDKARLLLCDCRGSMAPDAAAIARGTGLACSRLHAELCRAEAGVVAEALSRPGPVLVACEQEAARFAEIAEDAAAMERLGWVDIRDRAGWAGPGEAVGPKMAALVADARLPAPDLPLFDVESAGLCLVYGAEAVALPAAARLAEVLTVTVMLTDRPEIAAPPAGADVVTGRIRNLAGSLGRFELTVDAFAELAPAGRGARAFGKPADGARSACDIVVDLSGGTPLVPAPEKRDGYLRADPCDPLAVERVLFEAAQLTGTFEKPLHIRLTESLCAHSRAEQTGCTRCLDVCPTGAISPAGEHVTIDTGVCAGCGACSAVCPSGAAATEEPPVAHLFRRMRAMAEAFRAAGGEGPRLLVHEGHGAEMIRLGARHGRGLPGAVVPMEIAALASFGHAEMLAALALGFSAVDILAAPMTERAVIGGQIALAEAILAAAPQGAGRLRLIDEADPDALMEILHGPAPAPHGCEPILAVGGRRETVRLAARALAGGVPEAPVPLPAGAPYGAVLVDTDACTLCLSCAGLCPTGALSDNPDRPELSFREEACIQCGLCEGLCPETAIRLVPQLELSDAAFAPRVLKEEEPFACIECGALFGVKSTIERITEKLSSHAMFRNSDNARLIQMCDDCRVRAQYHGDSAPFRFGERPKVRTTEDYLKERDGEG